LREITVDNLLSAEVVTPPTGNLVRTESKSIRSYSGT